MVDERDPKKVALGTRVREPHIERHIPPVSDYTRQRETPTQGNTLCCAAAAVHPKGGTARQPKTWPNRAPKNAQFS
jgi:hypothetical protein